VEVLRENTLEPVLTIDTPSVDALGRFVWTAQDTSGLLDITDNPSGADQKYFIRISRRADADDVDVRFWAAWETPLTWLFGPALQGRAAQVRCRDTTDALSEDEVYMQVVADGTRYPLGARHGAATEGAALDTSMDEDDEVEWTGRIFPRLGNNAHGVAFGDQRAIKYVSSLSLQLHEDDDTFTLGDDTSSVDFGPLGPLVGSQAAPDRHWFGTDYRLRGGSMSHERPGKPCQSNTDCEEPLICNGFCRQAQ
jgi:hypothetical protein